MSFFDRTYEDEQSPKHIFRNLAKCFRCKEDKYQDQMLTKQLKNKDPKIKGGDMILLCVKCNREETI